MSLISALNIAISSIDSLNTAIRTTSDNVSNANNENYNTRTVQYSTSQYGGVRVADIKRAVDDGLLRDLMNASSNNSYTGTLKTYYERLEQLTGTSDGVTALSDSMQKFVSAWQTFEASPETDAADRGVVLAGDSLINEIKRFSEGLNTIERSINIDIQGSVGDLNDTLAEIDKLNSQIVRDTSLGKPISSLENLRDKQVEKLSGLMAVTTFKHHDGSLAVYSSNGIDLVDANPSVFTWDEATHQLTKTDSTKDYSTLLPDGKLSAQIGFVRTDQNAVTSADGSIGVIKKLRNQLDEFAYSLVDNSTNTIVGTTQTGGGSNLVTDFGLSNGDTFNVTVIDSTPTTTVTGITIGPGVGQVDTVPELLTALNAITGVSARINAHGFLEISTTEQSLQIDDTGGTPMADLGITTGTAFTPRNPPTFARAYQDATANAGEAANFFEAMTGTTPDNVTRSNIRVNDTLFSGAEAVKKLSGNTVVQALTSPQRNMVGSGLALRNETYTGLAGGILVDLTSKSKNFSDSAEIQQMRYETTTTALRNEVGVNIDKEMAQLQILQNSYSATARVMSTVNEMFRALENAI